MDYSQANVLITGGMGFIGSHLARRLVHLGAQVTILDNFLPDHGANAFNIQDIRDKITVNISDVRNQESMRHFLARSDYLFNLAGQTSHAGSMSDPKTDMEINVIAQLQMLEACHRINPTIRIVFTSTRQIYGQPKTLPVKEDHPIQPMDINGIHKATGEQYHRLYHRLFNLPVCILRLTNTYGPGMRVQDGKQCFVGLWVRHLLEGKTLPIYGDGSQRRDLNHVDDCVEALLLAATHPVAQGKTYNLGSPEVVSLRQLADRMINLGYGGSCAHIPFPTERARIDIGDYYGDFSAIQHDLNWSPKTSLTAGLTQTLNYYQQHLMQYLA